MFKKIALLLVLMMTVYLVIPDTKLSSGAVKWLVDEQRPIADKDNLFHGLAGLTVPADQDFLKEGIRLVQSANTQLSIFLESDTHIQTGVRPDFDQHWYQPALTVNEGVNSLCEPRTQDCREIWLSQKDTIAGLLKDHQVLLNRYLELQKFTAYHTTLAADIRSPQPDFATLMAINRLHGAGIAVRFLSGEADPAIIALNHDINFLRRFLAGADTLTAKMIALAMLRHDLYIHASLMDATERLAYLFEEVSELNETERSFSGPISHEFRMNTNLAEEIKAYPELITGDLGVPGWLPFPLFRKNHSINMHYKAFSEILDRSRMNASRYHHYLRETPEPGLQPDWLDYMYNPIGSILFALSLPDFDKYIIRMHDMQGLITMINLKRTIRHDKIESSSIGNYLQQATGRFSEPYTGTAFDWNPVEYTLSFTSPDGANTRNSLRLVFKERKNL